MTEADSFRENLLEIEIANESNEKVSFLQLFRFTSNLDRLLLIFGTAVAIFVGLSKPLMGIILGDLTQSFINYARDISPLDATDPRRDKIYQELHNQVIYYCFLWLALAVTTLLTAFFKDLCFLTVSDNMVTRLRQEFIKSLLRQEVSWFDQQKTGALTVELFSNLERVKEGTGDHIGYMVLMISMFLGGIFTAFLKDWRLALASMSLCPLVALWGWYQNKKMLGLTTEQTKLDGEAGAVAEQALTSIRTVMYFNGQEHEIDKYQKVQNKGITLGTRYGFFSGLWMSVSMILLNSSLGICIWYGTFLVYEGKIEGGVVITIFITLQLCHSRLAQLGPIFTKIIRAQGAALSIYNIIDRQPEIDSYSTKGHHPLVEGRISVQNLSFTYPTRLDVPVLKNMTFSVEPGQTVALVGPSGSGKSTIVQLLLRFYDPTGGRIFLDDMEIDEFNIKYLRETIGVVSQEPILFNTTIEENIRYGRENISDPMIWTALRKANAFAFVKAFPKGLKTLVGDRGAQLSGGQKQRIAIARALVRDPKILLLDEATSALDTESERIVQQALENASEGRTTIVVAHRLSTIRNAGKIIAMRDGEFVEEGTHEDLLAKQGLYYDLVNNQVFTDTLDDKPEYKWCRSVSSEGTVPEYRRLHSVELEQVQEEGILEDETMLRLKKELAEENAEKVSLWSIVKEARPEWKLLIICFIATTMEGIIYPLLAYGFTELIKIFSGPKEEMLQEARLFFFIFVAMGVYYAATQLTHTTLFGLISERLSSRLRVKVYKNLMRQDGAYFDKPNHAPGRLMTRLGSDGSNMKPAINSRLGLIVAEIVTDLIGNGLSLYFCWQMAIVAMPIFPICFFLVTVTEKFITKKLLMDEKEMENCGKIAMEAMINIRTVQALNLQNKIYDNFCSHLAKITKSNLKKNLMQSACYGINQSLYFFVFVLCYRVALYYVAHDIADVQSVIRAIYLTGWASCSLGSIAQYLPDYTKARMAAGLLFKMIDQKTEIDSMSQSGGRPEIEGNILMNNVHFRYPQREDVQVLKGVDLALKQGQTVALVGASGCGKSTLVSLLERLYDPEDGQIEIDGNSLSTMNTKYLRSNISIVSQEPVLFDMSIKENIVYGLPEGTVSHMMMIEAAKKAKIHDFVSCLPDGYNTSVGSKGTQLSGGQKQRIAIARALVREPKILILDEATSALDTESEKHVQMALDQAKTGRSCLVIAHRLSTVRNAHQILVMSAGTIVEKGTHEDLLQKKGVYYNIVQKQTQSS